MTGSAQRGQVLGLGPEQVHGSLRQGLSHHASTVGVGDQPGICHVPPPGSRRIEVMPASSPSVPSSAWSTSLPAIADSRLGSLTSTVYTAADLMRSESG